MCRTAEQYRLRPLLTYTTPRMIPVARRRESDSRNPATVATHAPMPPTSTTSAVLRLRAAIRRTGGGRVTNRAVQRVPTRGAARTGVGARAGAGTPP